MRKFLPLLLCALAAPAFAFDVTATMPATNGADLCRLYMDGVPVGDVECGVPVLFEDLVTDPGEYAFTYTGVNAAGETVQSPVRTVNIGVINPPDPPTEPPGITVTCTDGAGEPVTCPATVTIVITP